MNYWKQFAEMLGLELKQEFEITDDGGIKDEDTYKITEDGFYYKTATIDVYIVGHPSVLYGLLDGYYKAVPKPWKPKKGEKYWYYSALGTNASWTIWGFYGVDLYRWNAGNCFKTEEEAKTKGKEIMEQIQKEFEKA